MKKPFECQGLGLVWGLGLAMNELSTTADSQQQNKCVPTYKNYKGGSVYGSEDDV